MIENFTLPKAIRESEEYRNLTQAAAKDFEGRFHHILEIVEDIYAWLNGANSSSYREFLDNTEVDLSVVQNLPSESGGKTTSYIVHSSWTFEASTSNMRHALPNELEQALNLEIPSVDCQMRDFRIWLERMAKSVELSINIFGDANSLSSAVAAYISMDILLGLMLVGCYKARLNANLLQQSE